MSFLKTLSTRVPTGWKEGVGAQALVPGKIFPAVPLVLSISFIKQDHRLRLGQ